MTGLDAWLHLLRLTADVAMLAAVRAVIFGHAPEPDPAALQERRDSGVSRDGAFTLQPPKGSPHD